MSAWELLAAAALYVSVAVRFANNDDPSMSVAFLAYAVANVAFFAASLSKVSN